MGNTTSDVNDSLKAQADSENGPELYKLVNVNAGGVLASLMRTAIKTKNFRELDEFIVREVPKYLYNSGDGAQVRDLVTIVSLTFRHLTKELKKYHKNFTREHFSESQKHRLDILN